ncbi:monooxygenase 2-like [Telopea speciosissima]|uniref:monooxygenase 2-like n=1 Tax=Telopea speciosissima TaxID=54955 RepID=UPI001CC7B8D6|nr:monooxygenase 2-like [Telopea speciosissima]
MEISEDVVIVGAGIAGLATALALKRVGVRCLVLEKSPELRATGAAISLLSNGWVALHHLGVAHKLTSSPPSLKGVVTNVANGATQEVSYTGVQRIQGKQNEHRMVHRKALLEALAEELPLGTIRFSSKLISIHTHITNEGFSIATLQLDDGTIIKAKVLVGCDGLHSVVGKWLGLKAPVHSGRVAVRGLTVFPQGHGFKQEFQQFVKTGLRAAFVPVNDKDLYWYMNYHSSSTGEEFGGDPKLILRVVKENLAKDFPPTYLEVVWHADLATVNWAPLMYRQPRNVIRGHLCKGNITVAGDAMHPMTPGLGQGGGSALEDAVVLGRHIGNSFLQNGRQIMPADVERAIEGYVKERRWRVSGLITASYLAGWAQQVKSGWLTKLIRDIIFYKLLYSFIFGSTYFDCGELPRVPSKVE